jgi:hypothetical protein
MPGGTKNSPALDRPDDDLLAAAMERAARAGRWRVAERLCSRVGAPHSPRLAEAVARLHLAMDRPRAALDIIERRSSRSTTMELLRCTCLVATGERRGAHLALHALVRRPDAPAAAHVLLALLDWHAGDLDAACHRISAAASSNDDAHTLAAGALMHTAAGADTAARRFAERLRDATLLGTRDVSLLSLPAGLGLLAPRGPAPNAQHVEALAHELIERPATIAVLVEGQRLAPVRTITRLIEEAVRIALPELDRPELARLALAQLALLDDRHAEAADQAQCGIARAPYSAPLRAAHEAATAEAPTASIEFVEPAAATPNTTEPLRTGNGPDPAPDDRPMPRERAA